ncbi:hypothetical protein BAE44_0010393 [Dichanthelium oligosanthes]|uniref:Uncharacterized protein n=1 Tax=Dichanthelium oligosanthes TaxID=888268 RepID=A0A1E5VU17_9POAL|nr:hypothetical protein BAE44_0010393 [Dichanthelium oligosanthes]
MSRGGVGGGKLHHHLHHVSWLWRGPRRALCAARDLYVRSLTGCAGHLPGDAADEDLRELIRAASQRRAAEAAAQRHPAAVPRSQSVAMARIDEDQPCEFGGAAAVVFPRSQSCAAGAGRSAARRGRVAALAA